MKRTIFITSLLLLNSFMLTATAKDAPADQAIDPKVLKLALTAYNCASLSGKGTSNILTIVDYSKPSSQKRLWIFDLQKNKILFNSLVAHGQGSGDVFATRFSNQAQTHASSIGLFRTGNTYYGNNGYSLRLYGLENGYNGNALSRAIVVHGAPYVNNTQASNGRIGRSWGCPAVPQELAPSIINTIKNGTYVFSYYPNAKWLKESSYLNCSANPVYATNAAEKLLANIS